MVLSRFPLAKLQNIDKAEENPEGLHGHIDFATLNLLKDEREGEDEDVEKDESYSAYDQHILYYFGQVDLLDALYEFALDDFKLIFVGVVLNRPAIHAVEAQLLQEELDEVADPDYPVDAVGLSRLAGVGEQEWCFGGWFFGKILFPPSAAGDELGVGHVSNGMRARLVFPGIVVDGGWNFEGEVQGRGRLRGNYLLGLDVLSVG